MVNKRKRSRHAQSYDDEVDGDFGTSHPRASRRRVNYAESDDDVVDDEEEEVNEEEPALDDDEESEAAETPDEDDGDDSEEKPSGLTNGRSLRVKLRLRSGTRAAAMKEEAEEDNAEENIATQDVMDDEQPLEDDSDKPTRSSRRPPLQRHESTATNTQGTSTRRLSATSIRQQLLQHKQQPHRPGRNSANNRNSQTHYSDDEEFHLSSSGDDDGGDEFSEVSGNDDDDKHFVVHDDSDHSDSRRRSNRVTRSSVMTRSQQDRTHDDEDRELTLEQELAELQTTPPPEARRKNLRARREVNYQILPPVPVENYDDAYAYSSRRRTTSTSKRLYSTYGPFGGAGIRSIFGNQPRGSELQAAGGAADSDSSDDEAGKNPANKLPTLNDLDQVTNPSSALGLVKKSNLSDTDPLGVDMNIDFSAVGGLDDHINQLKEMVALPLMYPEVFQRFKITPPRGVLFHGPPGTGKTLLARALAASCSTNGRKISFYMRKGADALSKWVGEAERQLRLLFEEARNTQPSIIFFDEIDGLAPVRSSKQEQIHASIVSTLLALMDGMDNRGQVIVIGATNRPDSIDPALRRPGRFDREFYFPLPNIEARKKIIEIQTKGWEPPLDKSFIAEVATLTKGYGGADLRALCTESALNAIQRRYPQIYSSDDKLVIDPSTINVSPRDFIVSLKKIIPSSQRSTASNAHPLPKRMVPLLSHVLEEIKHSLDHIIPRQQKLTIAEEAMYEDDTTDNGFVRENMMQEFESARVFRPRMLIYGSPGMGQEYIGAAIMQYLEGYHVQTFDLATLLSDSARTVEAAIVQLFVEVKRHTPSVIYIPNIDSWHKTLSPSAWTTFQGLLRGISPVEQILLLGVVEREFEYLDYEVKALFGFSRANRIEIRRPSYDDRYKFFQELVNHIANAPTEYPDRSSRRKRILEVLPKAPPPTPKAISKAELKAQEDKDKRLKNYLKIKLSGLMDLLKVRYKRFRKPPIDDELLVHLFDEGLDPNIEYEYVLTDDEMIFERSTSKKYHNMDLDVVEERLWNGYYCTPKMFLKDIAFILEDANTSGDREKIVRASEMYANVQVSVDEIGDAQFLLDCERMYEREKQRSDRYQQKVKRRQEKLAATQLSTSSAIEAEGALHPETGYTGPRNLSQQQKSIANLFDDDEEHALPNGVSGANGGAESEDSLTKNQDEVEPMQVDEIGPSSERTPLADTSSVEGMHPLQDNNSTIIETSTMHIESLTEDLPIPEKRPEATSESQLACESSDLVAVPHPPYELDEDYLEQFHEDISKATDNLVVEQLEQISSALMDIAYRGRLNWDRNVVLDEAQRCKAAIIQDISMAHD
ncbi:P-loop containing nucleoside triphosphate hydrolase protein [Lipomyces kononenkoae]|uniref:P-loop containing nucleoside triphosphate hydrolase protein n=1 Tax=Lipomyces kononenkoae TaxID=34357 RepID=A0ACC3T2J3_LIPKO